MTSKTHQPPPYHDPYDEEIVSLYSILHSGNPGDVEFYLAQCLPTHHVLELGCGTGRLLRALVAKGCQTQGLDSSQAMLQAAQRTLTQDQLPSIPLHHASMYDFALEGTFDRILIPYNSLSCLLEDQHLLQCFQCCQKHLAPQGQLLFDVYQIPQSDLEEMSDPEPEFLVSFQHQGERIHVFEQRTWHSKQHQLDVRYIHQCQTETPPHTTRKFEYTIPQKYRTYERFLQLLDHAQLQPLFAYGGMKQEPRTPPSYHLVMGVIQKVGSKTKKNLRPQGNNIGHKSSP